MHDPHCVPVGMLFHLGIMIIESFTFKGNTWHNLCSELCCTAPAAKQDNGVGKRRRRPSRVIRSRLAVIVFDKDDDCGGLLFVDIFVEFDKH